MVQGRGLFLFKENRSLQFVRLTECSWYNKKIFNSHRHNPGSNSNEARQLLPLFGLKVLREGLWSTGAFKRVYF